MNMLNFINNLLTNPYAWLGRLTLFPENMGDGTMYSETNDPYKIDGYHFIDYGENAPGTGWYASPPNPPYDNEWGGRADPEKEERLNRSRDHYFLMQKSRQMNDARDKFNTSKHTSSPIILDLDGDGVETKAVNRGAWFDHDGNGYAESTGWVGKDDGLLVRDVDGSGYIDTGSELFGNNTKLANGQKAANGFEALKDLDAVANGGNADGKLDSNDTAWASLKVWKDANGDGFHSDGEVISLQDAGVQSINVAYTNSTLTDVNGNAHQQIGNFTKADGTTAQANDVWFSANYSMWRAVA